MAGRIASHRAWMFRSFALTFAAVTLRLQMPAAGMAGMSFEEFYPIIAWSCWVPNLVAAELWLAFSRKTARRFAAA